jgi:iron complex outermembrane receptor protein
LRSVQLTPDATGALFGNGFEGRAQGVEGWATWQANPRWRLTGGFTALSERFSVRPGYADFGGVSQISNDPRHTALLRSSWDLGRDWEADVTVRNVGHVPNYDVAGYTTADARIAWQVRRDLELSFIAQNVSDDGHAEFGPAPIRAVFDRAYLIKVRWQP